MANPRPIPTVRLRRIAAELKRLRESAGLTQEEVAERTGKDRSTLYRLERGQQKPQRSTMIQLLDLYGVDAERKSHLLTVLREIGQQGWMQPHPAGLLAVYAEYIGFEAEARSISNYESLLVPGLLQTEEYARAMTFGSVPHITPQQVEERVMVRMARQALLTAENPPRLWAIMDEAAARRVVGGRHVMRAQLKRICETAAMPNVTVQVIPYEAGAHPGMAGSSIMLEFADQADQSIVYLESMAGDMFLENDADLRRYMVMFEHLRAAAARPEESVDMLADIADAM